MQEFTSISRGANEYCTQLASSKCLSFNWCV